MKISFFGGARWVTGSNYLLEHGEIKVLVDCGLFQGRKYAEDLNYETFRYRPSDINYVLLTHSHTDHIGRVPKLYKDGFRGKIYATSATKDLMAVSLPDSLNKIIEEAKSSDHPPLFEAEDVLEALALVEGFDYDTEINLFPEVKVVFHDAGHILGSSIIQLTWRETGVSRNIFFSGDLGNPPTPLLMPTEFISHADYLVIESAYGDRVHEEREKRKEKLIKVIKETIDRQGVLMIPTFAMERTQELLYELNELINNKKIPPIPVFIDSPLAIKLTDVYKKHFKYFNKTAVYLIDSGDDIFNFPGLRMTPTVEESKSINNISPPKIIIAGSGMSHGGRILHHELRYLPDPKNAILFVGYQVDGSRGRHIQRGDKAITIFGQTVPVNCHIENISSYSSHADQRSLLEWVEKANSDQRLKKVFVVQGEETPSKTLAYLIREKIGVDAVSPLENEAFELN